MADLPPDFEVPTPRPGRASRPAIVSFAGWVFVIAGVLTGLGGAFYLTTGPSASGGAASFGLAFAAFGAAELVTGLQILRMSPAFRLIGLPIAGIGIVIDVASLVAGSRWQLVAIVLHGAALYGLATQGEAFARRG
ncbi:MAG: hypothetical protein HY240_04745 [Actinobacteria bacterium]|nr:hypothetical protein [Actinomycetota bacterium]